MNFQLFQKFTQIFMKLQFTMNPFDRNAERLKREYQTFSYNKPSLLIRGIDPEVVVNDYGNSIMDTPEHNEESKEESKS
jgi:hypothetical protein